MTEFDVSAAVGVAIGYLIAQVMRHLMRTRFWAGIRRGAGRMLDDPAIPVHDAHEAVERALVEYQRAKVDQIARELDTTKG